MKENGNDRCNEVLLDLLMKEVEEFGGHLVTCLVVNLLDFLIFA